MFWLALMGQNPLPSASCKMLVFLNNHSYSSPWFGYKVWELQLERVKQASCRCCARSKPPRSTTAKKSLQTPRAQHYSALFGPYSRIPACPPDSVSSILCKWCSLPTANYHLTIPVFSAEVHPVTCPAKQAIATWLDSLLSPFSRGKKINQPTTPRLALGRRGADSELAGGPSEGEQRQQQQPGPREHGSLQRADLKVGLSPPRRRGREGEKAALSQSRKTGRPWAFPVVQLKQAKTSLHLHSLRVSADWGPKFSHFQRTARREVLGEKPAAALLLTAFSALA